MFQRIVYTILVNRGRHITGCIHDFFRRIPHGNPDTDMAKHLNIISAIAKSHAFIQPDMKVFQHLIDPDPLAASKRYDIRKQWIPSCGLTM